MKRRKQILIDENIKRDFRQLLCGVLGFPGVPRNYEEILSKTILGLFSVSFSQICYLCEFTKLNKNMPSCSLKTMKFH